MSIGADFDVGGTFTDIVVANSTGQPSLHKILSGTAGCSDAICAGAERGRDTQR